MATHFRSPQFLAEDQMRRQKDNGEKGKRGNRGTATDDFMSGRPHNLLGCHPEKWTGGVLSFRGPFVVLPIAPVAC